MEANLITQMDSFITTVYDSVERQTFVKLTLSKSKAEQELRNVYVRLVVIKNVPKLSFTYSYKTNDQVKNFDVADGLLILKELLSETFKIATLFSTEADVVLLISKKGKASIQKAKATFTATEDTLHDKQKVKRVVDGSNYLKLLGIMDAEGAVIPRMADKYRQINKFLEIIESLLKETVLPAEVRVVDMGSGKGYLTFTLYEYLHHTLGLNVHITGIEVRQDLVDFCNDAAAQCGFGKLRFECQTIQDFKVEEVDILIALHACDTATDDALFKAIQAHAAVVVCAPCCHKQIRQQLKGKEFDNPILKHGIYKEREFEMVTDTMRALLLETEQYKTKIFEFISNEHTRKNIMLTGTKRTEKQDATESLQQVERLKSDYGISFHHLERLMGGKES